MKNKVISSFLVICMLFALLPLTASADEPKPLTTPIKLGDYVYMGTYDTNGDGTAEPILWRCVAFEKISGYDDKGDPITDSTKTVTEYRDGYLPQPAASAIINADADSTPMIFFIVNHSPKIYCSCFTHKYSIAYRM